MRARYATLAAVTDARQPLPDRRDAIDPSFAADELAHVTGGIVLHRSERPVRGAAVDSRRVEGGQAFVALPGERTDGHLYLEEAVASGATALIVSRPPADPSALGDVTVLRVPDGIRALQGMAAAWRTRFHPLVVGITGSIAKTSTKEAIAAVLATRLATLRSEGNQNNEIGLPLTLLRLGPEHEAAALEMGMYAGGEIADLARIARPRIGVVTAIQAVHLSRMGSIEAIAAAKGELVEALPPDGTAILNADDPRVMRLVGRTAADVLTYGFGPDADVRAEDVSSAGLGGMRFTLIAHGQRAPVAVPALGRMAVHNALGAAAVGIAAGLPLEAIVDGLSGGWSVAHRASAVRLGDVTVIDDSYNASPGSVVAALELLHGLPGRRVAVLGEMLELGAEHDAGHRQVGVAAAAVVDLLVVVGEAAGGIVEGAVEGGLAAGRILRAMDAEEALEVVAPRLRAGDVVLVKASRGVALERVVIGLRDALGPGR